MAIHILENFNSGVLSGYSPADNLQHFTVSNYGNHIQEGSHGLAVMYNSTVKPDGIFLFKSGVTIERGCVTTFYYKDAITNNAGNSLGVDGSGYFLMFVQPDLNSYYRVEFANQNSRIEKIQEGITTQLGSVQVGSGSTTWREVRIEWELDGTINLRVDDNSVSVSDTSFSSGSFGISFKSGTLKSPYKASFAMDNITVDGTVHLEEPPISNPPTVTIVSQSQQKVSDENGVDRATVTFTFDQDVTEWKVNVLGSSHDTGTLADSGGAVTQGTEITAEIDYTELYQEGQNRINIYGKNGEWTPYE